MIKVKNKKFYITTAIPYVNASPHLGHALEFVQTDALKRFHELLGEETFLVTGADENSLKNVQAAEREGISTQQLCDRNAEKFKELSHKIGLSYECFRKSTDKKEHIPGVQKLWELCKKSGDIYKKKYKGLYCVGCETFYRENELENGLCPEHKKKPEEVEEENYFFRLSKYQEKLKELIEKDELRIYPETRKHEILQFIEGGLEDFSISRSVDRAKGWGIPVPDQSDWKSVTSPLERNVQGTFEMRKNISNGLQIGSKPKTQFEDDPSQIMYVWFDALSCYITGVGYGFNEELFRKWWPAELHVIGKGITRFHAIYWPAMLLSAGLKVPKGLLIHGYITVEGQKMSKSLGNVLDPLELIEKYGVDQIRYYLLNEISTFQDGDFSEKKLVEKVNNELSANIGNLVNRTLVFLQNNFEGTIPTSEIDSRIIKEQKERYEKVKELLSSANLKEALDEVMGVGKAANKYFQENKPWELVKTDKKKCAKVVNTLLVQVKDLGILLYPFIPHASKRIFEMLNVKPANWKELGKIVAEKGHKIGTPEILFKKIEEKKEQPKPAQPKIEEKKEPTKFSDFDLEVGKILSVEKHPDAEKLFLEVIECSDGKRQVISGLADYYKAEELVGKHVVVIKNLKPAKIRGAISQGMLLVAEGGKEIEVLELPDCKVGEKIHLEGAQNNPRKEITIEEFFSVPIQVKEGAVVSEGKNLVAGTQKIETKKVKEGKVR